MTILVTGLVCGLLSMFFSPWADLAITLLGSMEEKKEGPVLRLAWFLVGDCLLSPLSF